MLAAEVATGEPGCVSQGAGDRGKGVQGQVPGHYRLPIRLPCLRCTVCLVTPSRPAMSCQDHPSFRRVIDLDDLQPLGERPQGRHSAEPGIRIGAGGALGDTGCRSHARQLRLRVNIC